MAVKYENGVPVGFACTARDIEPTLEDYEEYEREMQDKFCPVCDWELDMFGRCVFRNEPDHQDRMR